MILSELLKWFHMMIPILVHMIHMVMMILIQKTLFRLIMMKANLMQTQMKKIYVKMASGYVLDSIDVSYSKNGKYTNKKIKNGSSVNLTSSMQVSVSYYTKKKPVNYKAPSKWGAIVKSPLHNYNSLIFQ